jgi:hypothetical protein
VQLYRYFWVGLVSFAAIILCIASQRVFLYISSSTQSRNFWIHPRIIWTLLQAGKISSRAVLFPPPPPHTHFCLWDAVEGVGIDNWNTDPLTSRTCCCSPLKCACSRISDKTKQFGMEMKSNKDHKQRADLAIQSICYLSCTLHMKNACKILLGTLVTPRRRWKDNIKMDLTEIKR